MQTRDVEVKDTVKRTYAGEIEIEIRDKDGEVIKKYREPNIIKIFAKDILSHRAPSTTKWDPMAGSGTGGYGAWVDTEIDPDEEYSLKYILLGASFDENGIPLDVKDDRYYQQDPVTGLYRPLRLEPGAYYDGGLINAIPINEECKRPLKRIEDFRYEATYQPAGTPLLQEDVRAINNILICETTLRTDEYNGFRGLNEDAFTITEVALAAGRRIDHVDDCDITPNQVFSEGPYAATAVGGTNVVQLSCASTGTDDWCPFIHVGDQVKITSCDGTGGDITAGDDLDQVSPWYLVMDKENFGQNLVLDRVPTTSDGANISGDVCVTKNSLRIFSHRILNSPIKKTSDFEIRIAWHIIFS